MAHAAIPDHIFVQTDLTFDYVLQAIKELRKQGRIRETHAQRASLSGSIQGNDEEDPLQFGGARGNPAAAFGRTASAVVRMVMLEAVQIRKGLWPPFGANAMRRNKRNLEFSILHHDGEKFVLASEEQDARHYWAKYDHIYPHFWIEEQVSRNRGADCNMPSMMLIIRNNFTEIVEITTTFTAGWKDAIESSVNVLCIVREVCNIEGKADEKYTKKIKRLLVQREENPKTDIVKLFSELKLEMPANVN